ncbi:acyl-CoA thioester hydrolase/BAAT C-terminal domain-containing protein [Candidatus Villigracilis affinis]|uniref:acyl-CoA thioester hydrolase/BAAT C-terminal domain-containing protein n=1 Tax=Candidatus Villigracilis affinis TaxID=3140682 RepID=UPI002A207AEF|nr:hypothetical protein [Anaerolineales bacterium]
MGERRGIWGRGFLVSGVWPADACLCAQANQSKWATSGIVALHDHSDFKFYGKEKIADGPQETLPVLSNFRKIPYGGRAYANALAREGFVVLVHDVFLWGSRRFPLETMLAMMGSKTAELLQGRQTSDEIEFYNHAAYFHEHWVSKYCNILGTNMAGVVSFEDRVALNYLLSRADVNSERIGCIGLSGGGIRAALLSATYEGIRATVIIGFNDHLFGFAGSQHVSYLDVVSLAGLATETGLISPHVARPCRCWFNMICRMTYSQNQGCGKRISVYKVIMQIVENPMSISGNFIQVRTNLIWKCNRLLLNG